MAVIDLDILRPDAKIIKLKGHEIDVSFVPLAITFEIDDLIKGMASFDPETIQSDPEQLKKAFDMAIDLCVLFCSKKYPDMDREFFLNEVNAHQVNILSQEIKSTLLKSYEGVDRYQKNELAAKTT